MKSIFINRFDGGIAPSRNTRGSNICGACKHFDITSFPNKLVPYGGMIANTTGQFRIGNILIATNGIPHGLGTVSGSNADGKMFNKATIAGDWAAMSFDGVAGTLGSYRFFAEFNGYIYRTYGGGGTSLGDGTGAGITWVNFANNDGTSEALSFTTISNGVVHPATGYLYFGYDNKIRQVSTVGVTSTLALTLPSNATVTCIAPFGNFLAIAARIGSSTNFHSKVFLWDLNTTATWNQSIDWPGNLQVINEFKGFLVGVTATSNNGYSPYQNSILIHGYSNGGIPQRIGLLNTERQVNTTDPSVQINPNVNFVFADKFYFSADIVGGSTSPKYYGLWSLSKNETGQWALAIERSATSDNSETSVLAAGLIGDYVWMTHTANGTVTRTNGTTGVTSTTFDATSFYETVVNPGMSEDDYEKRKKLLAVRLNFYLPDTTSQVVLKYRPDRATAWTTVFTKTGTSPDTDTTGYRQTSIGSAQFTDARYYEFRFESVGGAEITSFSYEYDALNN